MFKRLKSLFDSATEAHRAALEFGGLSVAWRAMQPKLPQGDGHPVLFLPGFLSGDIYTAPIRSRVEAQGFKTYTWEGGTNLGLDAETAEHLKERLHEVYAENGGQKVSLVGHSLGGIYARELAREFPEMVRSVTTLGTPFAMLDDLDNSTAIPLEKIYRFLHPESDILSRKDIGKRSLTPPPVPTTSIYSRSDGVVRWKASLNPKAKRAENIEVFGSHLGMTFNPVTIATVIDRLAQPEHKWKPFASSKARFSIAYPSDKQPDLPKNPRWRKGKDGTLFKPKDPQ